MSLVVSLRASSFGCGTQESVKHVCGVAPMLRSRPGDRQGKTFTEIANLKESNIGTKVLIRARVHTNRVAGERRCAACVLLYDLA